VVGAVRREPDYECWISLNYEVLIVVLMSLIPSIELRSDCYSIVTFRLYQCPVVLMHVLYLFHLN